MNRDYLSVQIQKYKYAATPAEQDEVLTNAGVHIKVIKYQEVSTDAQGLYVLSQWQRTKVLNALRQKGYRLD